MGLAGADENMVLDAVAALVKDVQVTREALPTYRYIARILRQIGKQDFANVATSHLHRVLFFVGYSRSGHSLVGSLLDAHPDMVIAHELHLLKHLRKRVLDAVLLQALMINSTLYSRKGRAYTGYDYAVPGQYQGQYQCLRIVGDKKGNGSIRVLRRHPDLIPKLPQLLPVPPIFVHVVRNPFDNIATRAQRKRVSLRHAADGYFANTQVIQSLKAHYPKDVIDVHLEDLSANPKETLAGLVRKIGLQVDDAYLDACASIVFDSPRATRHAVKWPAELEQRVRKESLATPYLARYAGSSTAFNESVNESVNCG